MNFFSQSFKKTKPGLGVCESQRTHQRLWEPGSRAGALGVGLPLCSVAVSGFCGTEVPCLGQSARNRKYVSKNTHTYH